MPEYIRRRERITKREYSLYFENTGHPGSGWSPECDEHGNVDVEKMNACVRAEWDRVQSLGHEAAGYEAPEVVCRQWSYIEPAAIRCSCGREVTLPNPLENDCECGLTYNMAGQQVQKLDYFEDTGETRADVFGPMSRDGDRW